MRQSTNGNGAIEYKLVGPSLGSRIITETQQSEREERCQQPTLRDVHCEHSQESCEVFFSVPLNNMFHDPKRTPLQWQNQTPKILLETRVKCSHTIKKWSNSLKASLMVQESTCHKTQVARTRTRQFILVPPLARSTSHPHSCLKDPMGLQLLSHMHRRR